jgi:sec-independent protein translocase protein TatB
MGLNGPNFLGIGLPELMFIVVLGLVVLGPDRLPTVAKDLIRAFFRIRNLSKDLTGQLEAELGFDELKELRELKGMKTGGLVEAWANDELDLDLDGENSVTDQIEEEKKKKREKVRRERELKQRRDKAKREQQAKIDALLEKNKAAKEDDGTPGAKSDASAAGADDVADGDTETEPTNTIQNVGMDNLIGAGHVDPAYVGQDEKNSTGEPDTVPAADAEARAADADTAPNPEPVPAASERN